MSKKLIAVASAAALALTALVGIAPAQANTAALTVSVNGAGTSPGTALSPMLQTVPATNTLASTGSGTLSFANTADGDKITITTSGKVKITAAQTAGSADLNVTTLGTQNFTATASTTSFTAYFYTTDEVTTSINWLVERPSTGGKASGTAHVKGVDAGAAEAHTLEVVQAPSALAKGATTEVRVLIKDVFGNPIEADVTDAAVSGAANTIALLWDASNKWHDATITSSTDRAFALTIDGNGTANADDTVETPGFPDNKLSTVVIVNSAGALPTAVNAQVAALTAQLAASRPIATSVTKKKYNTLARKWNAAFPSQKVALKK
jgi:hypothetical protein